MSLFKRVVNIIKSSIITNQQSTKRIDVEDFDELYYGDISKFPKDNKEAEYYSILELEYGAGFKEIKTAYKKLLKKYHPDLYVNEPEKAKVAEKVSQKINEAYTYFERKYI